MYLDAAAVLAQHGLNAVGRNAAGKDVGALGQSVEGYEWFDNALQAIWDFPSNLWATLVSWFRSLGPPILWTFQLVYTVVAFVQAHPHPFHIVGWAIFFGPIILLLPALLIIELAILLLFYSTFLLHGFHSESLETRFEILKDQFIDWRESLFATVEAWTSQVNRWTTKHPALLVLRVLAGAMSSYLLIGIWIKWTSTEMVP